jgi:hypothetical protein
MHPHLCRLKVKPEVQEFFCEYYTEDISGNLIFHYGELTEHFGFAFHRIPVSEKLWIAGNYNFSLIRQVVICSSAMEAISWLNKNYYSFPAVDNLLFLSAGAGVDTRHIRWINQNLAGKEFILVFGRDVLGRIADVKLAAGIRGWPVKLYNENDDIIVSFRSQTFSFSQEIFSLNAFEKAAKYRFNIPAHKPINFNCFLDQLQDNAGLTL